MDDGRILTQPASHAIARGSEIGVHIRTALMIVQKAYKYRFFPTDSQKTQLARTFGCARFVWNQGLELRSKTYEESRQTAN